MAFSFKTLLACKISSKKALQTDFCHRRRNAAGMIPFGREITDHDIILDKQAWFNGISRPYQKCPIVKGILKDPENATRFWP